jgi:hypothetical protein
MCENTDKGRREQNSAKGPLLGSRMCQYPHKFENRKIFTNRTYISSSVCTESLSRKINSNYWPSMLNNIDIKLLTRFVVHELIFNVYSIYYFENNSVQRIQSVVPAISG